ncbi:hypothetical protein NDU88_001596 [Pleurodeles waltl]|uniref:Uncharacterized protein n=1 Tax=Pleurodeles waltl TaxID=8319 RepID=A0AAV7VZY1_PLEWA|nr:hypothetical protein NDU88_001596 [Pleurodeles waltl]
MASLAPFFRYMGASVGGAVGERAAVRKSVSLVPLFTASHHFKVPWARGRRLMPRATLKFLGRESDG